ncbi:MAG TPA: glycosyltransferase family 2 protein [Bacteroidales bacterium]|nr:glycosyltransferase family 2 protein [Bacteroidales bacterium]HOR81976.1 glycosyltransferase family 2 protein [Bacteroidales bacterium]HPJ91499.1 glycosyltransferase family 2 protein [Bacteroidales bacterium]
MTISIIVPTYKPDNYLFDCLSSIKNQTISHNLFEIIIVLNGCNEPYYTQIDTFVKEHFNNNIQCKLIQTERAGVSSARNIGLDLAEGDYIAFVDDDDILVNDYLESLLKVSNENSIGVANVKVFQDDLSVESDDYISKSYRKNISTSPTSIFLLRSFLSSSCAKLIHKEIIKNRRFDNRFRIGEDSLFMFLISDKIKEIRLASTIYYRRKRYDSASQIKRKNKEKIANSLALIKTFSAIYFKNIPNYRLSLFLSRLVAVFISIFKQ